MASAVFFSRAGSGSGSFDANALYMYEKELPVPVSPPTASSAASGDLSDAATPATVAPEYYAWLEFQTPTLCSVGASREERLADRCLTPCANRELVDCCEA